MTKSNYAYEIEIKVSLSDLKQDLKKYHKHKEKMINKLFFAIPTKLLKHKDLIPEYAGIIEIIDRNPDLPLSKDSLACKKIREAQVKSNYKFTDKERFNLARLGTMRILNLKKEERRLQRRIKILESQLLV